MASIRATTEVLKAYVADGNGRMLSLWNALPDGLDRSLVASAMQKAMRDGHASRAVGRRLNDSYFDVYLAELQKHPRWPETIAALMVGPERQRARLGEVFRKWRLLLNARGAAAERVRAFAQDDEFTHVLTAIFAGADLDPIMRSRCLGVLLEAGRPETLDAVLPFVEEALKDGGDDLTDLRTRLHAITRPTPAIKPLIETVERAARRRPGRTEEPKLMQALGLKHRDTPLQWEWSTLSLRGALATVITLNVDFNTEPWFRVHVTEMRGEALLRESRLTSRGTNPNQFELPPLKHLLEFPRWVAGAMRQLGSSWEESRLVAQTAADQRLLRRWHDGAT